MTVPANLFIDAPEAEDPSMTQMSSDSNEWGEQAITKLKERVPAVANYSLAIKFMAKDDEIGTATGSVTITDGEKAGVVPIIIRDFQMYPLDVLMFEGRSIPLTPDYFAKAFKDGNESAFSSLTEFPMLNIFERYMKGENLQNVIFPPNWGRYAYASASDANEKYPLLSEISRSIDGEAFKKRAMLDPAAVARYEDKQPGLLAKVANLRPVNMAEFRQGVDNLVMRTVHVLKKDGPNKYTILSNAKDTFNPAMKACDRPGICSFLSKVCDKVDDVLNEVDQNGEKVITIEDDLSMSPFLAKPETGQVVAADHFGLYNVRTKTGLNVQGLVVPVVIDFNQHRVDTKLFLGKTVSTMQPEIWGVEMTGKDRWMPEGCMPMVGQTGTFFLNDGNKAGLATIPVTIKSAMSQDTGNSYEIAMEAVDIHGQSLRIKVMPNCSRLERIVALPDDKGVKYLVPGNMTWVPMEGFDDLSANPYAYAEKVASEAKGPAVTVMSTGYGFYAANGVEKYAKELEWDQTMLNSAQVKFLLASMGAGEQKIAEILGEANLRKSASIHGLNFPPLMEEKTASYEGKAEELLKIAGSLRKDLFKEASYIESAQTVDALLSLNFVTPENVSKFLSKIPLFKATISHLTACLLASRLGLREVPEQATSTAISKLTQVVDGLEALRAINASKGK